MRDLLGAAFLGVTCLFFGGHSWTRLAQQNTKPSQATKPTVITNDNLCSQLAGGTTAKEPHPTQQSDSANDAFLVRIAGRWRLDGFRRGNAYWWPGHELSRPKTETDYLIGPRSVIVESVPEFRLPFITARYRLGGVSRVSDVLFDVQFAKLSDTCAVGDSQTARFKLSADGKKLEITKDPDDTEPTVEMLTLLDANWTAPTIKDKTP